ncbi:R3H domain-containing protein 2 isoform X1 [Syngnathus scovelli]|uniref:R3H domain-containing protein 2 isoform X1 n=1 Tax=Syngnathus scovelli TaxID=161590 RepID=UPI002110C605|nr:R3H domain-containing protein 2 isoform X1 [Syngnathus scovelli]XP_049588837.1 R3H domain-containing protein 2 isoform X1 [Syngnathus scovelli]XP_049588839.1 R3H domain-containing protein 2 isoform X1 [Syngnathus scovelli]XP_049588840.1 R3H domain-containing protein 2 isoform X1 [Syngnathus scovelli]
MSVSLTPDIQKEGESGPLIEPCGRGKTSPQPQGPKEGTGEGPEPEDGTPQDVQKRAPNHSHGRKRAKSNAKLKLVRSLAVCEESSGPFANDGPPESDIIQLHISCPSDKEEEKSSKEDYENEEKEKKDKGPRKMLSRDSSQEYTDSTGIDVHEFLVNTLKNNPRDRMMLLKLEQDILEFINDDNNQYKKFPQMTSYHRMLLHRVAAYFGMDHNVDQTGKAVIINKTGNTRIPEQRFSEHIKDERNMDFQKKFILKRDDASMDKDDNQIRVPLQDGRRSKSIEEREEEYQRVRDRIFAREVSFFLQSSQNGYINDNRLSTEGYCSSSQKRRQIFRGNRDSSSRASSSRQSSTDSDMKCLEPRPWSSTDSDSSNRTLRPPVTKASSFSGISILTRGDSLGSNKGSQGSCKGSRSASQSSRSLLPCPTQPPPQQAQPQALPQAALLPTPQQHPMGNHIIAQPVASLQPSQPVSYSSPSCPQVLLPVSPPQQYTMGEELAPQFGQMTLSRQGSSENPEPSSLYQAPPTVLSQHPPQTSYIMATTGQPMPPPSGYQPATGHPHPPPPPPPPSQPVMQAAPPQGYMQPPPPQQIQVTYYPPGQYSSSGQQYRVAQPMSHQVSYPAQRTQPMPQPAQQSGLQSMMPSQQASYQGMMGVQQQQNPALLNSQRAGIGGQMQSIMVQYPQMPSYQVPVGNESQQVVQQQYQQQVMVPVSQSVQGPMPVFYSVITPTQQNSTSPSVGYLQPPSSEQYQITPSPSPCNPQQLQQQYSGVPPPGPGVMVMQLSVPNGPQPSQNPPLVQWNPCKYYSIEQRPGKPGELYKADNTPQANTQLTSPLASPTQSPAPSPSGNVNSVCPGLGPLPLIPQFPRPGGTAPGDGRYSLLGQPLQYSLCPPQLMHGQSSYNSHQGQGVMKHGARGKKQTLKSASTDLGTTDVVVSRVLEVTDLPEGISRPDAEKLFNQLSLCGAKIQWLKEPQGGRGGCGPAGAAGMAGSCVGGDPAHLYTVVAVFPSTMAAQSASFKLNNSAAGLFKLRAAKKNYDLRVLERASSQ